MAKAVFENLQAETPKNHFTIGIVDDLTHTSFPWDDNFTGSLPVGIHQAMFFGLGADGTVGANKNSIKIIGEKTTFYAQGYFVYDSEIRTLTTSHLRFGPTPIRSTYLIKKAQFVACHNFSFIDRYEMLESVVEGGTFLLNSSYDADEVWQHLPREVQQQIIDKKLKFYVIDGIKLAKSIGLGGRLTSLCKPFFLISGILPEAKAMELIKLAVEDTYDKGQKVVDMNIRAATLAKAHPTGKGVQQSTALTPSPNVREDMPEFVRGSAILCRSRRPAAGVADARRQHLPRTRPSTRSSRCHRNSVWGPKACIQCNQCAFTCPHATIRTKVYPAQYANSLRTASVDGCHR
jgi:pyruvate-ferredoxin/flavodoxin oxidoreductase